MVDVLGLEVSVNRIDEVCRNLYKDWQNARKMKDFNEADRLRRILVEKGVL